MPHVVMLLTNPFRPDPRVHKEARSLVQAGYQVTVICWDRQGELPPVEQVDGFEIRRKVIQSGYGVGSRQVFYLPRFWRLALKELQVLKPDIVHCHDLDTAPVGYRYSLTHQTPWIFDAHEAYPEMTTDMKVNRTIYYFLLFLEKQMAKRASHVITVGKLLAQRFKSMGGCVTVVGNYQHLDIFKPQGIVSRVDLGLSPDAFVVAYIGGFTRARAIIPAIEATGQFPEVTFLLLGDGAQRQAIEARLPQYPRVRYLGHVPQEHVVDYTNLADVIYYGLVAEDANNRYSAPNNLFNALAAGKPLITTNIGEIAHVVKEEQCGVVVEQPTPELIAESMRQLHDPVFRQRLGQNARRAAENKYNWDAAEAQLLNVYRQLPLKN